MKNRSKRQAKTPQGQIRKAPEPPMQPSVTEEQIRTRAYEIYMRRGGGHGHAWDDWITAERELRGS